MANFAKIDENNLVVDVVKIHNNEILNENGEESEAVGIAFLKSLYGEDTEWVQTSYNNNIRGSFTGIEWRYDADLDLFIEPKEFDSWILNTSTGRYEAPTPRPDPETGVWEWNEEEQKWDEWVPKGTPEDDPSRDE